MSTFGKGLKHKANGAPGGAPEPMAKLGKRAPIPLMDLDLEKIKFGTKVETGKQGDKFVRCTYGPEDQRLEISLATLPNFCRAPFEAGPPKMQDGQPLGNQWSYSVELTPEQYDKWVALEALVVKKLQPLRNELFPAEAKKKKGGLTEDNFADKYNSKLTPPNVEKGYPANLRIFIETDPEKPAPKVQLMHLLDGNKCTRPKLGSVSDLTRGAAVVPVIALVRGVYAGQTGLGCKFAGTAIDVLTNLQRTNEPAVDYSGVEFVDEETPDAAAAAEPPAAAQDEDDNWGGEDDSGHNRAQMDADMAQFEG